MKKLRTSLAIIAAALLAFNAAVVFADTGPPGKSGLILVNAHTSLLLCSGDAALGTVPDIALNAFVLNTVIDNAGLCAANFENTILVNSGRHVFRDSATNPAAERAAPSNLANLASFSITPGENPQVIALNGSGCNTPVLSTAATGSLLNGKAKESNIEKKIANTETRISTLGAFASNTLSTSTRSGPPIESIGSSGTNLVNNLDEKNFGQPQIAHDVGARDRLSLVTTAGG